MTPYRRPGSIARRPAGRPRIYLTCVLTKSPVCLEKCLRREGISELQTQLHPQITKIKSLLIPKNHQHFSTLLSFNTLSQVLMDQAWCSTCRGLTLRCPLPLDPSEEDRLQEHGLAVFERELRDVEASATAGCHYCMLIQSTMLFHCGAAETGHSHVAGWRDGFPLWRDYRSTVLPSW